MKSIKVSFSLKVVTSKHTIPIVDNKTRWNSVHNMLVNYNSCEAAINSILKSSKTQSHIMGPAEKKLINDLISVFKVFRDVSELLQGSNFGTFGNVILCYENLVRDLNEMLQSAEEESLIEQVITSLLENLKNRFPIRSIHKLAAILDPGCSVTDTINRMSVAKKIEILKYYWFEFDLGEVIPIEKSSTPNESLDVAQKFRILMMKKIGKERPKPPSNDLESEISKYLDCAIDTEITLEGFWKRHQKVFPKLYLLASAVYGLPATSASSESGFSVAGNTLSTNNFRLSGERVNQQCFISLNRKVLERTGYLDKSTKVLF